MKLKIILVLVLITSSAFKIDRILVDEDGNIEVDNGNIEVEEDGEMEAERVLFDEEEEEFVCRPPC